MTPEPTQAELEGAALLAVQYKLPNMAVHDVHQLVLLLRQVLRDGSFD